MTSSSHPKNNPDTLHLSQALPQEGGTTLQVLETIAPKDMSALPGVTEAPRSKKRQEETPRSYYDVPMLKPPVWKWEIATYFFLGGLSAGAYLIARMASRFGGKRYQDIEQAGTLIAAAAFAPCPLLLIRDLGDRKRFHYMLRVFKPKSPMNLGSWVLSGYGAFVTLATLNEWRKAGVEPRRHGEHGGKQRSRETTGNTGNTGTTGQARSELTRGMGFWDRNLREQEEEGQSHLLASPVLNGVIDAALDGGGVPLALLLAGYTGVLLSTSSTPLWARKNWLGALFSASALSTGASAIELTLQARSPNAEAQPSHAPLKVVETTAKVVEAVTLAGYLMEAGKLAAPITKGKYAPHLWGGAVGAGLIGSALLGAVPVKNPKTRRALRITGAAMGLAGGLALRWAISQGGHLSGKDPQAAREANKPGSK